MLDGWSRFPAALRGAVVRNSRAGAAARPGQNEKPPMRSESLDELLDFADLGVSTARMNL